MICHISNGNPDLSPGNTLEVTSVFKVVEDVVDTPDMFPRKLVSGPSSPKSNSFAVYFDWKVRGPIHAYKLFEKENISSCETGKTNNISKRLSFMSSLQILCFP